MGEAARGTEMRDMPFRLRLLEVVLTSSNNLNVYLPHPKILGAHMDLVAREIGKPACTCLFVVGRGLGCSSTKRDFSDRGRNHPGLLSKMPLAHLLCCVTGNNEICSHCLFFQEVTEKGEERLPRRGQGTGVLQCLKNH